MLSKKRRLFCKCVLVFLVLGIVGSVGVLTGMVAR